VIIPPNIDIKRLPRHVAIIMDGNGRWAKKRGLPRILGHRAGAKTIRTIVEAASDMGIGALTLYAFSTENWSRPTLEVRGLMLILKEFLKKELAKMMRNNIKMRTIGNVSALPQPALKELNHVIEETKNNSGMVLNLALNYGARQELVNAVQHIVDAQPAKVTEEIIGKYLYTHGLPDPDILIRTSGELRISNFLLWQIAYTELYFTQVLWPDFKPADLVEAIVEFQKRERRFGKTSEQL